MRQIKIRKTPRRSLRPVDSPQLELAPHRPDTAAAEDLLDRINDVLEIA